MSRRNPFAAPSPGTIARTGRLLVDARAARQRGALLLAHQLGRVDQQQSRLPHAPQVALRVDHRAGLGRLDPGDPVEAQRLHQVDLLAQALHVALGRGDAQEPRADLVAVELLAVDERLELVDRTLHVGVRGLEEGLAAQHRRGAEAKADDGHREGAVAAAGAVPDRPRLEHGDVERRVEVLERDRRGEAREAAADDGHVGRQLAFDRRRGLIGSVLVEPERERGVGQADHLTRTSGAGHRGRQGEPPVCRRPAPSTRPRALSYAAARQKTRGVDGAPCPAMPRRLVSRGPGSVRHSSRARSPRPRSRAPAAAPAACRPTCGSWSGRSAGRTAPGTCPDGG